ncbi:MAG: TonB C-terminal domain-containing protein, partial [Gemmatimonadales bacterium]|nr:TonB C-terminal domain-containing protein [Gemmatimonadales bacterium]
AKKAPAAVPLARRPAPSPAKTPPRPTPTPTPAPAAATPAEREPSAKPQSPAPAAAAPGVAPGAGLDAVTVRTPGIDFPYPEYLRNILNQVFRRWDAAKVPLRAEVSFLILRDGSVRNIAFVRRSGDFSFDLEAQGAVEAAGNARAFGALPDGWPNDVLPVSFVFEPSRAR